MFTKIIDLEHLIHSTKTAIACMLGFGLTKFLASMDYPSDPWIVISIIVIMCAQIYVGSVVQKSYFRFLGTLLGCIMASLALTYLGTSYLMTIATIGVTTFFFSYLATSQDNLSVTGTLGAVTTAVILLIPHPSIQLALHRFLEISAGIGIAFLVSQFVFPIHARTQLRHTQAETLEKLRDYFALTVKPKDIKTLEQDISELDEASVKLLLKQRQLAKECKHERFGATFDNEHFSQSLFYEREILRAITFMQTALSRLKIEDAFFIYSETAQDFSKNIIEALNVLIKHIKNKNTQQNHIHIPSLVLLQNELSTIKNSSAEILLYSHGLLFSASILADSLAKLAEIFHVTVYAHKGPLSN